MYFGDMAGSVWNIGGVGRSVAWARACLRSLDQGDVAEMVNVEGR